MVGRIFGATDSEKSLHMQLSPSASPKWIIQNPGLKNGTNKGEIEFQAHMILWMNFEWTIYIFPPDL
jgi:hypothetical protein